MKQKIVLTTFFLMMLSLSVFVSTVDVPSLPEETLTDTTDTSINIQL